MSPDLYFFNLIHAFSGQSRFLDFIGVFFADYLAYFLLLAAVIAFFNLKKKFYFFSLTTLSVLLSRGLITDIIRLIYERQRPFVSLNFTPLISQVPIASFPSGHAVFFFAVAFAMWFFNRAWSYWFLAGAFLMGLARVFVGVHWPSDILAGALVGLLSVLVIKYILPKPMRNENANDAK